MPKFVTPRCNCGLLFTFDFSTIFFSCGFHFFLFFSSCSIFILSCPQHFHIKIDAWVFSQWMLLLRVVKISGGDGGKWFSKKFLCFSCAMKDFCRLSSGRWLQTIIISNEENNIFNRAHIAQSFQMIRLVSFHYLSTISLIATLWKTNCESRSLVLMSLYVCKFLLFSIINVLESINFIGQFCSILICNCNRQANNLIEIFNKPVWIYINEIRCC